MTWDPIDCIEQNGIISFYLTKFHTRENDHRVSGMVLGTSFTADGLTPNTSYTFQVAGVNDAGTGPFTDTIVINTDEEGVRMLYNELLMSLHFFL